MMKVSSGLFDALGTANDAIKIVDPSSHWPALFAREAARIGAACGELIHRIEHVGSTAVPGLAAKPILDIMPGVRTFEDGARCILPMERLGHTSKGEFGIPGRHFFTLAHEHRTVVHVHVFVIGCERWRETLVFRDALRHSPAWCREYESLKRRLAAQHRCDRDAYTEGKSAFIRGVIDAARAEA